uniref:RecA family profile 2 domain-containing protein n=1 Tax=Lactuca sativa TaxID=4236 RepID=A0A9R1XFP0_LACSA|nr:hypothetical protein LSAT_V11C400171370 [Lactuca sativa]
MELLCLLGCGECTGPTAARNSWCKYQKSSHPNSTENLLSIVDTFTQSGAVDVIVIDNVVALIPQREITGGLKVNEVTCGGNSLPFYSAVRMRIARKGFSSHRKRFKIIIIVTGLGICVKVVKNKLAPAMKKAELEIEFGRGISRAYEVLQYLGCLKEGNNGEVVNGKIQVETYLIQNTIICDKLVMTLRRHLFRIEQDSES